MAVYRLHQKEWEKGFSQPSSSNQPTPRNPRYKPKASSSNASASKKGTSSSGLPVVVKKAGQKVVDGLGTGTIVSSGSRKGTKADVEVKKVDEWWKQLPMSGVMKK